MKWLDAKRNRAPIENKMTPGPSADKSEPSSPEKAPAVSGSPTEPNRPKATPAAVRMAEAEGIDLSTLKGSGVDGLIVVSDVQSAIDGRDRES